MTRSGTNPHQTFARDSRRVAGLERSREREIKEGVKTQKCSGKRKRHSAPRHIRNITTHRSYVTNPTNVPEKPSLLFVILVVRPSHILGRAVSFMGEDITERDIDGFESDPII